MMAALARPDLLTPEEVEEGEFDWHLVSQYLLPRRMDFMVGGGSPDAAGRAAFEQRPVALGLTEQDLRRIEVLLAAGAVSPVQSRLERDFLREKMLMALIPCSGVGDWPGLLAILRRERARGTLPPVPKWYVWSPRSHGPRDLGLNACDARGCLAAEDDDTRMHRCGGCLATRYCGAACQRADWRARHKWLCAETKAEHDDDVEIGEGIGRFVRHFQERGAAAGAGAGGAGRGRGGGRSRG